MKTYTLTLDKADLTALYRAKTALGRQMLAAEAGREKTLKRGMGTKKIYDNWLKILNKDCERMSILLKQIDWEELEK